MLKNKNPFLFMTNSKSSANKASVEQDSPLVNSKDYSPPKHRRQHSAYTFDSDSPPSTKDENIGRYHSNKLAFTMNMQDLDAPKILVYNLEDINFHTKIPKSFLQRMLEFSQEWYILMSVRVQDPDKSSNRRHDLQLSKILNADIKDQHENEGYAPKDTRSASKTNPSGSICSGRIPMDQEFQIPGAYNLLDNNFSGNFPAEAKSVPKALRKNLEQQIPELRKIKKIGNLLCYQCVVDTYQKDTVNKNQLVKAKPIHKYFIQEEETLRTIFNRLEKNPETFQKYENGKLYVEYQFHGKLLNIRIDLDRLIPHLDLKIPESFSTAQELINFIDDNNLSSYHAPMWFQKHKDADYIPIMNQSGDNGFAITGDVDLQHLGMKLDLPASAYVGYISKITEPAAFIQGLNNLYKALPNDHVLKKTVKDAAKYYKKHLHLLKGIGTSTIYSLVMQYLFKHPLWLHGSEDMHPSATPEKFGGILSVWNKNFVITGDEKSYLDFLFHDPEILSVQEIGVHPNWIRDRNDSEMIQGVNLSEYWLDLIRIQALNSPHPENYFNNLATKIGVADRKSTNTVAFKKINSIQLELHELFSNAQKRQAMIADIYSKYQTHTDKITLKMPAKMSPLRLY